MKQSNGGYIDVPYMREAVLVNLGALMQQWTADVYLATVSSNDSLVPSLSTPQIFSMKNRGRATVTMLMVVHITC